MKEIYKNNALCIHGGCEMADQCLRALGYRDVENGDVEFPIVNPALATGGESCPFLATAKVVRYARGFRKVMDKVTGEQKSAIYKTLMSHFGKNPYYDTRNGKYLISPGQQDYIRSVFEESGVRGLEYFDAYEERTEWKARS